MPAVWLMVLGMPGVGVLIGGAVMYGVGEVVAMDLAGFIAGMLGINLLLDLALVRLQKRGLGAPTAHDQVGRVCRVVHAEQVRDGVARARVMLDGVRWRAESAVPLEAGQCVRVANRQGLTLDVVPDEEDPVGGERET